MKQRGNPRPLRGGRRLEGNRATFQEEYLVFHDPAGRAVPGGIHAHPAVFTAAHYSISRPGGFLYVRLRDGTAEHLLPAGVPPQPEAEYPEHHPVCAAWLPGGLLHREIREEQGHADGLRRLPDVHEPGHPLLQLDGHPRKEGYRQQVPGGDRTLREAAEPPL